MEEFERISRAIRYSLDCGLQANAGHGLDYDNVTSIAAIEGVAELNIGHSIVARAIAVGLPQAVSEMKKLIAEAT